MDIETFEFLTLPSSDEMVTVSADDLREAVHELAGWRGVEPDEWDEWRVWVRLARALGMTPKDF